MAWEQFKGMVAELTPLSIFVRMFAAMLVGMLVGFDRRLRNNSAGMRTHALVCMGAAVTMLLSQYVAVQYPDYSIDVSRIGAGVVGGVGFLGAGTIIMTDNNRVHGLATAAGLWACSCIGLAAGMGFVDGTIIATAFMLFTLFFLRKADRKIVQNTKYLELYVEFEDQAGVRQFQDLSREQGVSISELQLREGTVEGDGPVAVVSVVLPSIDARKPYYKSLKAAEGVRYFQSM